MTALYVFLACMVLLGGLYLYARREGRRRAEGDAAKASNAVKDKQLQSAADAPHTREELVDRIRKEDW